MTDNLRVRSFLVLLFLIFCAVYLLPNIAKLPESWPLHRKPLNYGLDIQGGAHLVYGVDVQGVITERSERSARAIGKEQKTNGVETDSVATNEKKDSIVIKVKNPADRAKVVQHLKDHYGTTLQIVSDDAN